ncbi:MAG: dihydrodipicolinate synthase family protein [Bryobacterales bacterium]|nr:dihydrodipicolinate synthase family protein [Bryobacterales bacterium]
MSALPDAEDSVVSRLRAGAVIPAHPLALDSRRRLDERRQKALTRYYLAAGAGGVAVGVHTTQFAIHEPTVGLYRPVLELAAEATRERAEHESGAAIRIAGILGPTSQAVSEAGLAVDLGYDVGLLGFAGLRTASHAELLSHARAVAGVIPIMGFYLQPAVGGIPLPYEFWRDMCEIEGLVAIKVAPFDRYCTLEVLRAVCDSGRSDEIALYTGNDDNIIGDLLTSYASGGASAAFVGGLLGHWAVWTKTACDYWRQCRESMGADSGLVPNALLRLNAEVTDANSALFDTRNGFSGCIAGIHEVLRRQGLLAGNWCLNEAERLSPGQSAEIDRVCAAYPHLVDDDFVAEHLAEWLG